MYGTNCMEEVQYLKELRPSLEYKKSGKVSPLTDQYITIQFDVSDNLAKILLKGTCIVFLYQN